MPKLKEYNKQHTWLSFLVLIVACVLLNNLGTRLNGLIGMPLYLDCIGTILAALLGGYIPCIIVGFLSNFVTELTSPDSVYYSVISVFIAIAAVLFVRKLRRIRLLYVIEAVLTFAFLGGVVGAILTWLIYGMSFGEGFAVNFAASINRVMPIGYFSSNLLSAFLIDIVDKSIVTVVAILIYKLIPKKFVDNFKEQNWYYITMFDKSKRKVQKRMTLRMKTTLVVELSTTLVGVAAIVFSIFQYHDSTLDEYKHQAECSAGVIANHIIPEKIETFLKYGKKAEGYTEIEELMQNIKDVSPEIQYIYVYQIRKDGSHVIFDLDTEQVKADSPGSVIKYCETIERYSELFLSGKDIPSDITNGSEGWLMSVYEPIRDKAGKALGYVGIDMSMSRLRAEETAVLAKVISMLLSFLILIRTCVAWISERLIVKPVSTIADAANQFNYDTSQLRREGLKMIEELGIDTGDEIEYLYDVYKSLTTDIVRYINEVEQKNEQIIHLQNGLVLVLANIVESRDKCTGDHVFKTAIYCRIILYQMKEDGIYAEQLSEEFIDEVIHSAPLHDIGKIKVSDTILNKAGRLTEEEFGIIQQHTLAGGEIIDKVISVAGKESGYLVEAKNLAVYHHEKWNGKGYPAGLSGDAIPLSARVMAVADVFDALVSRRSYKEPFSVDEAFEIIREEAGSHFDPLIVKAFMNAEDEIRRIQLLKMDI